MAQEPSATTRAVGLAFRIASLAWLGAVLGEFAWLNVDLGAPPRIELIHALLVASTLALPLALLLLPFVASLHGRTGRHRSDADSRVRASARALAWLTLACLFGLASYALDLRILLGLSRLEFVAVALALGNLLLALCLLALRPGLQRLFGRTLRVMADSPLEPGLALLVPPARLFSGLLALSLGLGVVGVYRTRRVWEAVDWPRGLALGCGGLFVSALAWALRRHRYAHLAILAGVILVGLALCFFPGVSRGGWLLGPVPRVGFSSRAGLSLLRASVDFDHDGFLSFAGDGDCAPFDRSRHPTATDVPGDGIDQDCDGRDSELGRVEFAHFGTHLLASGFDRRPPLILLLTVDAFNPRRLHRFGAARDPMPAFERLFDESVFFRHAFAQGPSTRLSFPALFASRWDTELPRRLEGRHPYPLEDSVTTLAERLSAAGYRTAAIAPTPMFRPPRWKGLLQGFERSVLAAPLRGHAHGAKQVTDAALAQLESHDTRPLFLWVHYFDAHPPQIQPAGGPVFGTRPEDRYDAELHHIDTQAGRLLAAIETRFGDRAWIVVTGDHARAFDSPRHARHGYGYDLYTSVLHVPLAIRVTGMEPGELDAPVSLLDLTPTLIDLLGLVPDQADDFRGRSLVPAMTRRPAGEPAHLYSQFYIHERLWTDQDPLEEVSVMTDSRHLILDRRTGRRELYDWRVDTFEQNDLMASEPDIAHTLSDELAAYLRAVYQPAANVAQVDAGVSDAGVSDAGVSDAGVSDAGVSDAGVSDAGVSDAGVSDAGVSDAGVSDAGAARSDDDFSQVL